MKKKGFTLIEMLVVILIVSIIISFSILATGDFGKKRKLNNNTEQFIELIKLLRTKAMLNSQVFAIKSSKNFYEVLELKITPNGNINWIKTNDKKLLGKKYLGSNAKLIFKTKNSSFSDEKIIISSFGKITPFELTIKNDYASFVIKLDSKGEVKKLEINE